MLQIKSRHRRCSVKKGVLKNFTNFTRKHQCWSPFFNKVAGAYDFIKKETPTQVFSCEICEIFKNTYFEEHLRTTDSIKSITCISLKSDARNYFKVTVNPTTKQ